MKLNAMAQGGFTESKTFNKTLKAHPGLGIYLNVVGPNLQTLANYKELLETC